MYTYKSLQQLGMQVVTMALAWGGDGFFTDARRGHD